MLSNKKQKYFQALWKTFRWRMARPSKVSPHLMSAMYDGAQHGFCSMALPKRSGSPEL